jgi:CobB/CobQ-like glutamine amidotransferase domain
MCGVLEADTAMTSKLTLGYRDAVALTGSPLGPAGIRVRGHEFHRTAVRPGGLTANAWRWQARDAVITEGFVSGRVHASYLHTHWNGVPGAAARITAAAREFSRARGLTRTMSRLNDDMTEIADLPAAARVSVAALGFAAMGVVETLIHTFDVVRGLNPADPWRPPAALAAPVLARLFPHAPSGDPTDVLLYCCGRASLGQLPRQTEWQWDSTLRT